MLSIIIPLKSISFHSISSILIIVIDDPFQCVTDSATLCRWAGSLALRLQLAVARSTQGEDPPNRPYYYVSILVQSTLLYSVLSILFLSVQLYSILFYFNRNREFQERYSKAQRTSLSNSISFHSISLYFILFYYIPFHLILFNLITFHCIPFNSTLFLYILIHSILFHSIPFHSM